MRKLLAFSLVLMLWFLGPYSSSFTIASAMGSSTQDAAQELPPEALSVFSNPIWAGYKPVAIATSGEPEDPDFVYVVMRNGAHNVFCLLSREDDAYELLIQNENAVYQGGVTPCLEGDDISFTLSYDHDAPMVGEPISETYRFWYYEGTWDFDKLTLHYPEDSDDTRYWTLDFQDEELSLARWTTDGQWMSVDASTIRRMPQDSEAYLPTVFNITQCNQALAVLRAELSIVRQPLPDDDPTGLLPPGVSTALASTEWADYKPMVAGYSKEGDPPSQVFVLLQKGEHNVLCSLKITSRGDYGLVFANDQAVLQGAYLPTMYFDENGYASTFSFVYEEPPEEGAPESGYYFDTGETETKWRFVGADRWYREMYDPDQPSAKLDIHKMLFFPEGDEFVYEEQWFITGMGWQDYDELTRMDFDGSLNRIEDFSIARCNALSDALVNKYTREIDEEPDADEDIDDKDADSGRSEVLPSGKLSELLDKAKALLDAEQFEQALLAYDNALALDPKSAEANSGLGDTLICLDRYSEALLRLDAAVKLAPNNGEYMCSRGFAFYMLGRKEEALKDFLQAVELAPAYMDAHICLAALLYEFGELEAAQAACIQGLFVDSKNDEISLLLGDIQFSMDDFEGALYIYDRVISHGNYTSEDIFHYEETKEKAS